MSAWELVRHAPKQNGVVAERRLCRCGAVEFVLHPDSYTARFVGAPDRGTHTVYECVSYTGMLLSTRPDYLAWDY